MPNQKVKLKTNNNMILSFELTMPNVSSWNGRWTGEDKKYFIIQKVSKETGEEILKDATSLPIYEGHFARRIVGYKNPSTSFYYNFGDGWGASVIVEKIDSKEASKRRKKSSGFCGYDWMVSEILKHGRILEYQERKLLRSNK